MSMPSYTDAPFHAPVDMARGSIDRAMKRFEKHYIPEPNSGCWLWLAGLNRQGYGKFHFGRTTFAHRASWILHFRCEPAGFVHVLHRCDQPCCVNPEHLFLGSHADNMNDKATKGRQFRPRGELNAQAKLSDAEVAQLRKLRSRGASQKDLAAQFGVSQPTVSDIVNRKAYANVD